MRAMTGVIGLICLTIWSFLVLRLERFYTLDPLYHHPCFVPFHSFPSFCQTAVTTEWIQHCLWFSPPSHGINQLLALIYQLNDQPIPVKHHCEPWLVCKHLFSILVHISSLNKQKPTASQNGKVDLPAKGKRVYQRILTHIAMHLIKRERRQESGGLPVRIIWGGNDRRKLFWLPSFVSMVMSAHWPTFSAVHWSLT